jgi:hypothetical protein
MAPVGRSPVHGGRLPHRIAAHRLRTPSGRFRVFAAGSDGRRLFRANRLEGAGQPPSYATPGFAPGVVHRPRPHLPYIHSAGVSQDQAGYRSPGASRHGELVRRPLARATHRLGGALQPACLHAGEPGSPVQHPGADHQPLQRAQCRRAGERPRAVLSRPGRRLFRGAGATTGLSQPGRGARARGGDPGRKPFAHSRTEWRVCAEATELRTGAASGRARCGTLCSLPIAGSRARDPEAKRAWSSGANGIRRSVS